MFIIQYPQDIFNQIEYKFLALELGMRNHSYLITESQNFTGSRNHMMTTKLKIIILKTARSTISEYLISHC